MGPVSPSIIAVSEGPIKEQALTLSGRVVSSALLKKSVQIEEEIIRVTITGAESIFHANIISQLIPLAYIKSHPQIQA